MGVDRFSSDSSSSSSSSSYLFENVGGSTKLSKHPSQFKSVLHSVRRPVMEKPPWKKQPVAPPLPPIRHRVYKVDPINFRDLVQKLTGATEVSDHRLQTLAQAPLNVASPVFYSNAVVPKTPLSAMLMQELRSAGVEEETQKINQGMEGSSYLALNLSPSSQDWFHFPLVSPVIHSTLDIM